MKINKRIGLLILITIQILLSLSPLFGQGKADTVIARKLNYLLYPYAFYTPETQFAFGGGGMLYFRTTYNIVINPSKIVLGGYYTTNDQYYLQASPSLYFPGNNRLFVEAELNYGKEKAKYHGIGNDAPELESPEFLLNSFNAFIELRLNSFIFRGLKSGILFDFSQNSIEAQSNFLLTDPDLTGYNGGNVSGLGISYTKDDRHNVFYPESGLYYKASFTLYNKLLGSQFNFNKVLIDLRNYFTIKNSHIMAFQIYGKFLFGNTPFFRLAELGSSHIMRGYFKGRFRDQRYIAAQVEYRKIFWWRFGIAMFAGTGQVSPDFNSFKVSKFKPSAGGGLRFVFDEKEKINVRIDVGFGDNTNGVYFSLEEAF